MKVRSCTLAHCRALGNYSYDVNGTEYSPIINAEVHSFTITVPASGGRIELIFHNNDRNLQIRLPLSFTIGCEGAASCADVVWSPPAGLTRVFDQGEIGDNGKACACFRIPAIARAPDGTLLAFAEGRCASCWPDVRAGNTIVMKRSLDGGRGNQWSNFTTLAFRAGDCGMNYPTPMVDRVSGRVWLFYYCSCDVDITWLITSDDSGRTWSEPVNMSAVVPQFHFAMAGAGGGIQLKTGRLVVLCSGTLVNKTGSCGALAACFSDDHGKTWLRGANMPCGVGVHGLGEASVAHVDGRPGGDAALTAFVRVGSGSALLNHALAESADGGATWSPAVLVPEIVGPTCAGSVGPAGPGEALLSAPYSHDAGLGGRENLFVWRVNLSNPGSPSFETAGRLWPCATAYSHFSEDGLLNLFEAGPVMRYQQILLARMNTTS